MADLTVEQIIESIERGLSDVPRIAAIRRELSMVLREAKLGSQLRQLMLLVGEPASE